MQRIQSVVLLSQTLLALVIASRLYKPSGHRYKHLEDPTFKSVTHSLNKGEWVVRIQGHGPDVAAPSRSGKYIDNPWLVRIGNSSVRIPEWYGRLGNNLHQVFHAIVYAESEAIPLVELPDAGPINDVFDLPTNLNIQPRPSSKVECSFDTNYFFVQDCSLSMGKDQIRQALLTYVKPLLKQTIGEVCRSKETANRTDLAIHLRGGDLVGSDHPQSRMPPCSFYHHLITTRKFSNVILVAEDGERDHFCRKQLLTTFEGSEVVVKETDHSLIDDVCTLMTSQHVSFGLTTFAESLTMMNDRLKTVHVPALKANGNRDMEYGGEGDISGTLECDGDFNKCAKGFIEYEMYHIPGFGKIRTGNTKLNYILHKNVTYSQPRQSCGHCVL